MTASAVAALRSPYRSMPSAAEVGVWPVAAPRMDSRFETPGLVAGSKRTSVSLSVTARLNFFSMAAGSSSSRIVPCAPSSDLDILFSGCWRSMTLAPAGGITTSGTTNVSPYRLLNRTAMSRANSMC